MQRPLTSEPAELVTFGSGNNAVTFRGRRISPGIFPQSYTGFRTGSGADRTALTDLTKVKISDLSGGLDPTPGIKSWLRDLNKFRYNEGWQTRLPGLCILPYDLLNQSSITSDEDISAGVAAGWRAHAVSTSLNDTESRFYVAIGHKVFRNVGNGNSSLEVCYTTTDVITSMAVLNVNGTPRLTVATNGATDDVFYVADPTGMWSGNTTVLVALSSGDYITAMQYFPTIGAGTNIMVGEIGGTNGVWWQDIATAAAWTMRPLVTEASKNTVGNLSSTTESEVLPSFAGQSGEGFDSGGYGRGVWISTGNITAEDTSYAQYLVSEADSISATKGVSSYLEAFYDVSSLIEKSEVVTGVTIRVRVKISATTAIDAARLTEAYLTVNGNTQGQARAVGTSIGTTEEDNSMGSSTDDWGAVLSGADAERFGVKFRFHIDADFNSPPSASNTIDVDTVGATFTHKELGDMVSFALGGWGVSPSPAFPERLAIVVPATKDDASAITEPRVMWFLDFRWDTAQERPVMNYSRPNTGLNYIHHVAPFQGGWAITGNNSAGPGISLKHVDSSGNLRDFSFPAHNGLEEYRVNSLYPQGSWLVMDCVANDYSDRQWWFYNNGRFFPDTILQSLSDGLNIAAQPIPYSTVAIDLENDIIYSIFPNSTDTAVARQFLPSDLGADPRIVRADQVKTQATTSTDEDTALFIQLVELDIGPEEANKSILVAEYLGRRISAATGASYGSVELDIATDADTTFASAEITTEFTSAFQKYNVPAAGVAYRTALVRIGGNHDADSAESPDGLPILITTAQDWPIERTYAFEVYDLVEPNNIFEFMDSIDALVDEKITQPLDFAEYPNQPAKFDRYLVPEEGLLLPARSTIPAPQHFEDAQGNLVRIGMMFHTVPGTGSA